MIGAKDWRSSHCVCTPATTSRSFISELRQNDTKGCLHQHNNMNSDLDTSVPDWLIDHPESAAVFDELGIDTSCGGKSLRYLCQQKDLDPETILERLLNVIDIQEK